MPRSNETRVISFGLYGTKPKYLIGAIRNAQLAKVFYPGWTARFYHSAEVRFASAGPSVPMPPTVADTRILPPPPTTTLPTHTYHRCRRCHCRWRPKHPLLVGPAASGWVKRDGTWQCAGIVAHRRADVAAIAHPRPKRRARPRLACAWARHPSQEHVLHGHGPQVPCRASGARCTTPAARAIPVPPLSSSRPARPRCTSLPRRRWARQGSRHGRPFFARGHRPKHAARLEV